MLKYSFLAKQIIKMISLPFSHEFAKYFWEYFYLSHYPITLVNADIYDDITHTFTK